MIVDLVTFRVKSDKASEFERHCDDWTRQMKRARGFVTQSLMRSLDHPAEYFAEVRWVSRDYRDRFHAEQDAERRTLQQKAHDLLDAPPDSRLVESV